jgi:hypothetical protein
VHVTAHAKPSYEFVCKTWTEQPTRFRVDPTHLTPGPNNYLAFLAAVLGALDKLSY